MTTHAQAKSSLGTPDILSQGQRPLDSLNKGNIIFFLLLGIGVHRHHDTYHTGNNSHTSYNDMFRGLQMDIWLVYSHAHLVNSLVIIY
jgi:hypothetical protein